MYGPNHPERIKLNNQIRDWNTNRLDLFEISEPNEYLEFYGVMRFFYQGEDLKYQTKCLRVSSTATTLDLIDAVVIKFHPDLKMLSNDRYALYESHNMQDRKMKDNEHPLIVQLNWAYDDKDGKFILKNESRRRRSTDLTGHAMLNNYGMSKSTSALGNQYESQTLRSQSSAVYSTSSSNFFSKRMLSSKKSRRRSRGKDSIQDAEEAKRIAAELSGKPPESSFTRTISNPDEVMKRRRQRKLESRLEEFSGDKETGGTLKIYGDSINPDIPYKTLLLSVNDTAEKVLSETLDKYGLSQEDHRFYLLVQQNIPPKTDRQRGEMPEEIILHDQDCPLGILVHCPPKRGNATFAVRRRTPIDKYPPKPRMPPFSVPRESLPKSPRSPKLKTRDNNIAKTSPSYSMPTNEIEEVTDYPRLIKLLIDEDGNLFDGDEIFSLISLISNDSKDLPPSEGSKFIKIGSQPTQVGNYPNILLTKDYYPDIRPTHCHISAKIDPQRDTVKFTLTPTLDSSSRTPKPCMVYINQSKIEKPTKLQDEDIIQIGEAVLFKFEDPNVEQNNLEIKSSNSVVNQSGQDDQSDSFHVNYYTADLPVTLKHPYNLSERIVDRIMSLSRDYAEEGIKDLFSCNVESKFHNIDDLFQLGPAYTFYLLLRSGLGKEKYVSNLINNISQNIEQVIQEDKGSVEKEVFWLSNASELLHLLQCDNDLRNYSGPAQEILASAIEQAFSILQSQFSQDLMILLPAFIDEDDSDLNDNTREDISPCLDRASDLINYGDIDYPIQHLLQTLSLAYNLFHNCQVNVALTIQMFSQLFHLLNTWLFNSVLGDSASSGAGNVSNPLPVCPEWGARLTRRLNRIKDWSEINGLDMAANCHLQKMYQVAELMEADKRDLNVFGEKCLELMNINGTQLHFLLENCEDVELPNAWIEVVVNTAIQWHDQAFNGGVPQNKNSLPLYEDLDLRLPLLLPADGYCCDRGIVSFPKNLKNILNSLNDMVSYKPNPPTTNQIDTRWKTYLGPYENTPSVSRSGTMVEQSPSVPLKINIQPGLPRNIIGDEPNSIALSSPDSQSNSADRKHQETKFPSLGSKRPTELSLSNHRLASTDLSDDSNEMEIFKGDLKYRYKLKLKKMNNSLGLSIIAARKSQNDIFRIYIKDVIPGGAGHRVGKIETGDQLVSVDGHLLEDINQNEAVEFMKKTKSVVNLLMEKGAAQRHGVLGIILKSKSLKAAAAQSNPKNPPSLPVEPIKVPKPKLSSNQYKTPVTTGRSSNNSQPPQRSISRENISFKNPPPENENRKRSDYKLPPVPQYAKVPPRPAKAPPTNRNKVRIDDIVVSDQEYHSLPVRKHRSNQHQAPKAPEYGVINKVKSPSFDDSTYYSLQNVSNKPKQPRSQSTLVLNMPKKRLDTPVSSNSSSSESISTSDEEESVAKKVPISKPNNQNKKNISLYSKHPPPPQPSKQKVDLHKSPVKALSENNLQTSGRIMPQNEMTSSDNPINLRSSKNRFLIRPTIAPSSEPIMDNNSESSLENLNLKNPVNVPNRKHRSQSSSESESETLSSVTQSLSSDPSPKPQRKMNSEPIISLKQNELRPSSTGTTNYNGNLNNAAQLKPNNNFKYPDPPIPVVANKIEPVQPTQPKVDFNVPKVNQEKSIKLVPTSIRPISFQMSPPPVPTASYPQYHPPSVLEENDWSTGSNKQPVKPPSEEEIRMRRKAIEDKIRYETDIHNRKDEYISTPPETRPQSTALPENSQVNASRNSTRYGRPTFNDTNKGNRPESLYTLPTDDAQTNFTFPLPPPSLLEKGIIVPASSTKKSPISGENDTYIDPFKKSQENTPSRSPESAEKLSFKEKMQLFAQKNGESEIVMRNRFSSKQRKIESGNFS